MLSLLMLLMPDPSRLGHDEWSVREATHEQFKAWGPWAWPVLLSAQTNESPEVRVRVAELLATYRSFKLDLQAIAILSGAKYNLSAVFQDDRLRARIYSLAIKCGCDKTEAARLDSANDVWCWWASWPPQVEFANAVTSCCAIIKKRQQ